MHFINKQLQIQKLESLEVCDEAVGGTLQLAAKLAHEARQYSASLTKGEAITQVLFRGGGG